MAVGVGRAGVPGREGAATGRQAPSVWHMLTDTQVQVLSAINDQCEIQRPMKLDPLPDLLADLELPNGEVYQAVADLHELGLIVGVTVEEFDYPVLVSGLTARGRQELP